MSLVLPRSNPKCLEMSKDILFIKQYKINKGSGMLEVKCLEDAFEACMEENPHLLICNVKYNMLSVRQRFEYK